MAERRLPNIDPEFIVIFASAWCNDNGVGISYSWDGERFNNRNDAIQHGMKTRHSDDFNIGQTYGDDLIWFGWMDQQMDEDEATMADIADNIGLTFDPRWHDLKFSKATVGEARRQPHHLRPRLLRHERRPSDGDHPWRIPRGCKR